MLNPHTCGVGFVSRYFPPTFCVANVVTVSKRVASADRGWPVGCW
jgi:hypothetical protein